MTALNIVLKPGRALMMTDAAMYLPSGLIVGFGAKALPMPTLGAVIACRGGQLQTAVLAMDLPLKAETFEDLTSDIDHFASVIETTLQQAAHKFEWPGLEVVVAGFYEGDAMPRAFFYSTYTGEAEAIEEFGFGPLPDELEEDRLFSIGCDMERNLSVGRFDPVRHGVPIMEAQRRMKTMVPDLQTDGPMHIVGGHILLTEVTRLGISQRIIHRWPDLAGENIRPEPFGKKGGKKQTKAKARAA